MRLLTIFFMIFAVLILTLAVTGQIPQKTKILIITGGHEFEREFFFNMFAAMPDIEFTSAEHPAANNIYAAEALENYDVLVYYDMNQDISEEQKKAFLQMVEKGKGLVFLHHSLASYQDWPEYMHIQGGRYHLDPQDTSKKSTYKHDVQMDVKVLDPDHPVTKGIADFTIHDEVYENFEVLPTVHPLLKTDHPESGEIIGWAQQTGKTKSVTIQLGHDHFAYENENFSRLVYQAIRWGAGK